MQKEYKTRHNWVGKVNHWEIFKKFKFDSSAKWHMHKTESIVENETHEILCDFLIQNRSVNPGQKTRSSNSFKLENL